MNATGGRVAALTVGLPFVVAAAVYGAFTMVGTFAHASERHVVSYPWKGGAITLRTAGDVTVEVGSDANVGVTYSERYQLKRPTVTSSESASGLQLTATCPGWHFGSNCAVNYVLTVPVTAALNIRSGDGDIHLSGTSAAATLDSGAGGIEFDNVTGNVAAQSGDGDISGSQVGSTNVQVSTGAGDVNIDWSVAPTTVVATSGDGGIHLVLPQSSGPYRTSTHAGNGSVHVSSLVDSTAAASITATTGTGDISIGYATP
ncbi:MAG TPA: DUF4097 family beta strand repeat-containing protein [Acidothermaceae bacterium]|jgi:hypothetical protein